MKLLAKWLSCVLAIWLVGLILPHNVLSSGYMPLVAGGTLLFFLNMTLRPIAKALTMPLTIITFGIFSLVVNVFMVWLTGTLVPGLEIHGFFTMLIISFFVSVIHSILKKKDK